jgi:putative redox protein
MNTSELVYQGELRTLATHVYSGTQLFTDAPLDNQGKAQSFSPTDLVAVALATCVITTIAILLKQEQLVLKGSKLAVRKIMVSNPRRIGAIELDIEITDTQLSIEKKTRLETIAHSCPVAKSLHPDIEQRITFSYR